LEHDKKTIEDEYEVFPSLIGIFSIQYCAHELGLTFLSDADTSVADTKLLFSDPDPTCRIILDLIWITIPP